MKVKNINPVERHVEKAVLAICILAAGYLGYSALTSPITFQDQDSSPPQDVAVQDVEKNIRQAVDKMNDLRDQNNKKVALWENPWRTPINTGTDNNVPSDIVQHPYGERQSIVFVPFPRFKTLGTIGPGPEKEPDTKIVVAKPLPPGTPKASVVTGRFVTDPTLWAGAGGAAPAPGAPGAGAGTAIVATTMPSSIDQKTRVKVEAAFDLDATRAAIQNASSDPNKKLDDSLTKQVTYVDVILQRKEVTPEGDKGDWTTVAKTGIDKDALPLKPDLSAAGRDAALTTANGERSIVLEPRYYPETTLAVKASTPKPTPTSTGPRPLTPLTPPPVAPTPEPGGTPPTTPTTPTTPTDWAAIITPIPAPVAIPDDANILIWAYDDKVDPGKTYKYRIAVVIANPAYGTDAPLEDGTLKFQQALQSAYSPESPLISIDAHQYMYAMGGAMDKLTASFQIFQLLEGKVEHQPDNDVVIGDTVQIKDRSDMSTDYVLVDVQGAANKPTAVVLMDTKTGRLAVRDLKTDNAAGEARLKELTDKEAATHPAGAAN